MIIFYSLKLLGKDKPTRTLVIGKLERFLTHVLRVSSLGDEVYYALDSDGGMAGVTSKLTHINMKHQHSLESYQLYKEKLVKIREKQANMPGWEGVTPPAYTRPVQPAASQHAPRPAESPHLGGSMSKLSHTRLNTIQMGLAAIFNPENYIQQQ